LPYSVKQASQIYGVSTETIRTWSNTYQEFFSHGATQAGRKRLFTVEDTTVLSQIAELRDQDYSLDEIQVALKNGQRGKPPALEPQEIKDLSVENIDRKLMLEVERLSFVVTQLQEKLTTAESIAARVHNTEIENTRLTTEIKQVKQLRTELKEAKAEIREVRTEAKEKQEQLTRELGAQYNQGFKDGLKHE